MATARDIYMAANLSIKQHGQEAAILAATRADHLALKGDRAGEALWLRVLRAIKELERTAPAEGVRAQ